MQANEELAQLVQQRTWDKELLLWSGPEAKLLPALTGVQVETLDLLDLFDSGQLPIDDEAIRLHLSRTLRQRLGAVPRSPGKRTVLIVRSTLVSSHGIAWASVTSMNGSATTSRWSSCLSKGAAATRIGPKKWTVTQTD